MPADLLTTGRTFPPILNDNCFVRLESLQNTVDWAKVAAVAIAGKNVVYDSISWFWSDRYDIKLQMVGSSTGYKET